MAHKQRVYIVSDSVGDTAQYVVNAAASQFNSGHIYIKRYSYVKNFLELKNIVIEAEKEEGIIAFTLIDPELRDSLFKLSKKVNIPMIDIMGPMMDAFEQVLNIRPHLKPGLVHRLDHDYYKRVDAMEFTVKYDDRNDKKGIILADVVLVGVSRTSKTPMCIYLSYRGYKAANIPLVPEVEPSPLIFENPDNKVIGLTIDPLLLNEIRQERLKSLGLSPDSQYASIKRINEELEYADKIMQQIGCPVIDVTNKSIEESASEVMNYL
jgi:[pyruvate, water dikinase]-phosphate phosphotransferase / [pyruvate, water dikinase] kinase